MEINRQVVELGELPNSASRMRVVLEDGFGRSEALGVYHFAQQRLLRSDAPQLAVK